MEKLDFNEICDDRDFELSGKEGFAWDFLCVCFLLLECMVFVELNERKGERKEVEEACKENVSGREKREESERMEGINWLRFIAFSFIFLYVI